MKRTIVLAALLLFAAPLHVRAQSASQGPEHFYHLKFVVEELSDAGAVTNTRIYQTTVGASSNTPPQVIKTGSRIPITTGTDLKGIATQFQYIDLGVDMEVEHVAEAGDALKFHLRTNVSSMAKYSQIAGVSEPVIRENSWSSDVMVPIGKPRVVFSSDDLDSKGKMQVEITATPVDQN